MKAIETEYKGILFRSRLEARWAIFFDALKLEWVYEPDCFVLSNNQKYTPDFYIPKYKLYIEVKPSLWWQNIDYHKKRYELFEGNLLILSDDYPSMRVSKLYQIEDGKKYENVVVFCPNSKYEPFFYTGCDLGEMDDYFEGDYIEELNIVKSYRFYK
jgi:galactose-1-phosphate uridylyltransferase